MKTFSQVYAVLRRKNAGQYALLAGCNFFSVLLITAYICMMRSPTILAILPEGGDSRKQVMMIFVLAVIGCAVFTTYAAELFFRQKSRETGVFLALGVSRKQLKSELRKDLSVLSLCSCVAGAVLGSPLAWAIWTLFRVFLVNSEEMSLSFDPACYLLALVFAIYVIGMLFFRGGRFVRRQLRARFVEAERRGRGTGYRGLLLDRLDGAKGTLRVVRQHADRVDLSERSEILCDRYELL